MILRPPAGWIERVRAHPEVRGVLSAGGGGRGDVWPGSDLDLYVVWADDRRAALPEPGVADRFVDIHDVGVGALEQLIADQRAFAASERVDETAGGTPLYDPDGLLARWLEMVAARLADPGVRHARAAVRLTAARAALAAARDEADPLESALLARDAARLGAWAHVAGTGGLICSARRFADRYLAMAPPRVARIFAQTWGLGGGRPSVDDAIAGLRDALHDVLEVAIRGPAGAHEHFWVARYRATAPADRPALLASHPYPPLLAPALAHGYHDGVLMWMRGYYRLGFRDVLPTVPPADRPIQALRRFHGLRGGEPLRCGAYLDAVTGIALR